MNNKNNQISQNIFNLTTLWKLTGEICGSYNTIGNLNISQVSGSDWPSRMWFELLTNSQNDWDVTAFPLERSLKLSIFGGYSTEWTSILFKKFQIEKATHQTAMFLPKPWLFEGVKTIKLKQVKDSFEVEIWSSLFKQAFDYTIPPSLVINSFEFARYFLAQDNGQNVGTVMLYTDSNNNAGIHSLGVPPRFRRQGYAKEITISALQLLRKEMPENIFLQASDAAVNLYRVLGFKDQFEMNTYSFTRDKQNFKKH